MDPAACRGHFGVPAPDIATGARLAALRFTVRAPDALVAALAAGAAPHILHMGHVVVGPQHAMGATLVFGLPFLAGLTVSYWIWHRRNARTALERVPRPSRVINLPAARE